MNITFITSTFPTPSQLQLNALYSWGLAQIPVVVAGRLDDPPKLIARFPNVVHVPKTRTAWDMGVLSGAPLVKDIIANSLPLVQTQMVGLINADILIKEDFKDVMERVVSKHGCNIFLSGPRYDIAGNVTISTPDVLRMQFKTNRQHPDTSGDIFISSKSNFEALAKEMPDFFLGRLLWDNWIHLWFSKKGIPCFNTNPLLPTFHQSHDYSHISGELTKDPAVQHNLSIPCDRSNILKLNKWPSVTV